jgi:hypothetical protein
MEFLVNIMLFVNNQKFLIIPHNRLSLRDNIIVPDDVIILDKVMSRQR